MFRFILLFTITLLILFFITISYHPSLDIYSKYFINDNNSSSSFKATYLGASSIVITDGKTTILTDGFITRPSIYSLIFTQIKSDKELIKKTLQKINVKKIDAIITLHSHHDHAMDSAQVALQTGAFVVGSNSTATIAKAQYFYKIKTIKDKTIFQIGDFKLTIIPSRHTIVGKYLSKLVGIGETITDDFKSPAYFTKYKESKTYALHIEHKKGNIFINASTNFLKNSLDDYKAHTVFLGIANLAKNTKKFQEEYFKEVVLKLKAKRVIPIHWDDFTKDINSETKPMPKAFDDFDGSMKFIIEQTKENNITLEMLRIFDKSNLNK